MCLYLDVALKRYGYLKVISTLGNSPTVLQHLLLFKKKIICSHCAFLFGVLYETVHLDIDNVQPE